MHAVAAREALDRFISTVPAGLAADATLRTAATVRALFAAAVDERVQDPPSAGWADHNLAVLLVRALGPDMPDALREPAAELFFGVRRRLLAALAHDADDLAPALALAVGDRVLLDKPQLRFHERLAEDFAAIAAALGRPHAGHRLAHAALTTLLAAAHHRDEAIARASAPLVTPVRTAIDRLGARMPDHPDLALDRIRLLFLETRQHDEATPALGALSTARGLLDDFGRRFGLAAAQRDLWAELVAERARLGLGGPDLRTEAVRLLEIEVRERLHTPERTRRLLKALRKARVLDAALARELTTLLGLEHGAAERWDEVRALLLDALGDEKALLQIAERTLAADPHHGPSAKRLFERWLANVRQGLAAPFDSTIADRVLDATPAASLARLSTDELTALTTATAELFGHERAFRFVVRRVLETREQRGRNEVWLAALGLAQRTGTPTSTLELGRIIRGDKVPAEVRLEAARAFIDANEDAEVADELLRGLRGAKGPIGREVQTLTARLRSDPRLRDAHRRTLVAFEERIGVGSGKLLKMRVIYTSPAYALAEIIADGVPDCYEHKYLRTMVRDEELPEGTKAADLKKGDLLEGAVRGQDAHRDHDKGAGLRVYWLVDKVRVSSAPSRAEPAAPKAVETVAVETTESAAPAAPAVDPRELEAHFGIGGETPVEMRLAWDGRRKRIIVRLLDSAGEKFPAPVRCTTELLPEGFEPRRLGQRGKRFLGRIEAFDEGDKHLYRVVGPLTQVVSAAEPETDAAADDGAPEIEVTAV
jgi:hypothetical protein